MAVIKFSGLALRQGDEILFADNSRLMNCVVREFSSQENPIRKYIVVGNSNAMSTREVQEIEITFADSEASSTPPVLKETSSTPVVKETFNIEGYREVNKVAPTKVRGNFILILLVLSLFLAVIALSIAFSVEIAKLKYAGETPSAEQQSSVSTAATMGRLDNLNSSMDRLSQQLLQEIDSQTQQVARSLLQQVNSSLELLSQQLLQDISAIDSRTQRINSSQQMLSQQLFQDIYVIDSRTQQINSSQQMLSQQLQPPIANTSLTYSGGL